MSCEILRTCISGLEVITVRVASSSPSTAGLSAPLTLGSSLLTVWLVALLSCAWLRTTEPPLV